MLYSNNTEIVFYEAIQKIIKRSPDLLSKNVQIYLVYLMTNSAENFSINKVFDYIPSDCDKTTLLEMGDNILFATGYFQEYFWDKNIEKYFTIGRKSYYQLSSFVNSEKLKNTYMELSIKFEICSDLISDVKLILEANK